MRKLTTTTMTGPMFSHLFLIHSDKCDVGERDCGGGEQSTEDMRDNHTGFLL